MKQRSDCPAALQEEADWQEGECDVRLHQPSEQRLSGEGRGRGKGGGWGLCSLTITAYSSSPFGFSHLSFSLFFLSHICPWSCPNQHCCTVMVDKINVGEALVSKGLATALRHKYVTVKREKRTEALLNILGTNGLCDGRCCSRADDDQRSSTYDDLLAAETRCVDPGTGGIGEARVG